MSSRRTKALAGLLTSLFTTDELRRFVAFLPHGDVVAALPSGTASFKSIAFVMVQALEHRGQPDEHLLDSKRNAPHEKDELTRIRRLALDSTSPAALDPLSPPAIKQDSSVHLTVYAKTRPPDINDLAGERGQHEHFFGRWDVLRELDDWLQGRDSGSLLLLLPTARPAWAKARFFHHWLGLCEQAGLPVAFHFIRRCIWADSSNVRANLAAQIEWDFPELRDAGTDPARLSTRQPLKE